jgi:uncharacterized membrane protein YozB (DUF420 family)
MREQAIAAIAPDAIGRPRRVDRWFYISMALMMILFSVVAFGPSIIDPSNRNVPLPLTPLVLVHAIVSAAWLVLFLAQATLAATGRVALHRRVGVFGVLLTVAFILVGYFALIAEARRGFDLSGDGIGRAPGLPAAPDPNLVALLWNFLTFGIVAGLGLWYRHRPAVHKRLMLLAMLGGLTNTPLGHVVGHWPLLQPWAGVIFPVTTIVFLSASAIYDRVSQGRIHPVSLWGAILLFVWGGLFFSAIQPSAAWREFATWLIR